MKITQVTEGRLNSRTTPELDGDGSATFSFQHVHQRLVDVAEERNLVADATAVALLYEHLFGDSVPQHVIVEAQSRFDDRQNTPKELSALCHDFMEVYSTHYAMNVPLWKKNLDTARLGIFASLFAIGVITIAAVLLVVSTLLVAGFFVYRGISNWRATLGKIGTVARRAVGTGLENLASGIKK